MSGQNIQLGEYTLSHQIGAGGMAEVWMAERVRMGTRKSVAIKVLNPASREREDYQRMFLAEARMSMLLSHSSIVQVFDVGEYEGMCFMAMEWIDGLNLAQLNSLLWQRGERLPLHVAVYIIVEVLRALDHAHNLRTQESASIVHRDVSPQNVMLSVNGEVKLMDFGVARFSTEETAGVHVKGKLRYMPPEQLKGRSREPTVDLFAAGAVLHELLEGRRFRDTEDDVELLSMILEGGVPEPEVSRRGGVPAPVLEILDGLLDPDPRQRIGSARAALRMLSEWSGYQNAAIELEDYVVRYRELCPPTGSFDRPSSSVEALARPGGDSSAKHPLHAGVNPSTVTTYEQLGSDSVDDTNVSSLRRGVPRRRFNRMAAAAAAGLGLIIGLSAVGVTIRDVIVARFADEVAFWREAADYEPPEPSAEAVAQIPVEATPAPEPEPEPAPEPEPEPAPEPELELEEEPEPELILDLPPEPEPEEKPEQQDRDRPEVKVTFIAGNFGKLDIRVGNRRIKLNPYKKVKLPAGSHPLRIRPEGAKKWQRIGMVKFRAGQKYEVLMSMPKYFRVVAVK